MLQINDVKVPTYFRRFCELESYCCSSLQCLLQVTKSTQGPTETNAQQETLPILDTLYLVCSFRLVSIYPPLMGKIFVPNLLN